jgi:hypothetical protein
MFDIPQRMSPVDDYVFRFILQLAHQQWPEAERPTLGSWTGEWRASAIMPVLVDNGDGITGRRELEEISFGAYTYAVSDRSRDTENINGIRKHIIVMGYGPRSNMLLVANLREVRGVITKALEDMTRPERFITPPAVPDNSPGLGGKSGLTGDEPMLSCNRGKGEE